MISWALWDWGSSAFNAIILMFVFTVYLTKAVATDSDSGSAALGAGLTIAGVCIAVLAPVTSSAATPMAAESSGSPRTPRSWC